MKRFLKQSQIAAFRLTRHHLLGRSQADLAAVSRDVCGIQAQVTAAAQMALWARIPDLTRTAIHSALWESRTLVKTAAMRGTLHLLATSDFSIYIAALKRSRAEALWRIMSKFGITHREADVMTEAVADALRAGPMTQGELASHILPLVGKKVRAWMERVWSPFRPAIAQGLICYGPDRGQEVTLVRVDQWLPPPRGVSEDEAKQVLLRRYLRAYGPATLQDFSRWTGMSGEEARGVRAGLEDELVEVDTGNTKGLKRGIYLTQVAPTSCVLRAPRRWPP